MHSTTMPESLSVQSLTKKCVKNSTRHLVVRRNPPEKTIRPRTKPSPCRPDLDEETQRIQASRRRGPIEIQAQAAAAAVEHAADAPDPANRPNKRPRTTTTIAANDQSLPSLQESYVSKQASSVQDEDPSQTTTRTTSEFMPTTILPSIGMQVGTEAEMEETEAVKTVPNPQIAEEAAQGTELPSWTCIIS